MLVRKVRSTLLNSFRSRCGRQYNSSSRGTADKRRVKEAKLCREPFDWLKSARLLAVSSDWELVARSPIAAMMTIGAGDRTKAHLPLTMEAIPRRERSFQLSRRYR